MMAVESANLKRNTNQTFQALSPVSEKRRLVSFCLPLRPFVSLSAWNSSAATSGFCKMIFGICGFFGNLSRKFKLIKI
jgi:hypothetical protein